MDKLSTPPLRLLERPARVASRAPQRLPTRRPWWQRWLALATRPAR